MKECGATSPVTYNKYRILFFSSFLKKKNDFIGKRSLERLSMQSNNRKELVGLLSDDPKKVIPEGAHAIETDDLDSIDKNILGHVTSSYYSPNCRRSIAMALLKDGRSRKGSKVYLPLLNGEIVEAGSVNEVIDSPQNNYTKNLLQAVFGLSNFEIHKN